MISVLEKKLKCLVKNFKKNQYEFEKNSVVICGSLYGVDIILDNVVSTRNRLFNKFYEIYQKNFEKNCKKDLYCSIKFLFKLPVNFKK